MTIFNIPASAAGCVQTNRMTAIATTVPIRVFHICLSGNEKKNNLRNKPVDIYENHIFLISFKHRCNRIPTTVICSCVFLVRASICRIPSICFCVVSIMYRFAIELIVALAIPSQTAWYSPLRPEVLSDVG